MEVAIFTCNLTRLTLESTGPNITIMLGYWKVKQAGLGVAPGKEKCSGLTCWIGWDQPYHPVCHKHRYFLTDCDRTGLSHLIRSCQCNVASSQAGSISLAFIPKHASLLPAALKFLLQLNSLQIRRPKLTQRTTCKKNILQHIGLIVGCTIASGAWHLNGAFPQSRKPNPGENSTVAIFSSQSVK